MLKVQRLDERAILPTVAYPGEDLGFDIYALEDTLLFPMSRMLVKTGIVAVFDMTDIRKDGPKYGLLVRDRSSMAGKGIVVTGGVIDAGYRGELLVGLTSMINPVAYLIKAGERIAQLIPLPVLTGKGVAEVQILEDSSRGEKGFGSSGR